MIFGIDIAQIASLVSQWWVGPDGKMIANFVVRKNLRLSYALALTINLIGALSLYFSIRIAPLLYRLIFWSVSKLYRLSLRIIPTGLKKRVVSFVYVLKALGRLLRFKASKLIRVIKAKFNLNEDRFSQNSHDTISDYIERSRFTYITLFGLNFIPIPLIGMGLTAGSFVFIRRYKIRFGFAWVILTKLIKVTVFATLAYLYRPVASGFILILSFIEPANIYWAPIWTYMIAAYGEFVLSYLILLKHLRLT